MPAGSSADGRPGFDRLFSAESIAVVGASPDPGSITGRPLRFLEKHGYSGEVFPVNPSHETIGGSTCYDSVLDVDAEIDVAMILVPAKYVATVLEECGRKGVPFTVICSSGYSEVGDQGQSLERDLIEIADDYGIRLLGPNSIGFFNAVEPFPASFSSQLDRYDDIRTEEGLAFVTQSGSYGGLLFSIAQELGVGTKYWISTGNEIDIDAVELIEYVIEDPDVSMVVGYVESFERADELRAVCRKALALGKPIVVFTVGQSAASRRAVASHTGKMTGEHAITTAVLRDAGVVRLETVTDFRDVLSTYFSVPTVPSRSIRWGVLTPSGGAGALIADLLDRTGIGLAELSEETIASLREFIPPYGSVRNPVDTTGNVISDPGLYERAISVLVDDDAVDGVILQFGNSGDTMGESYEEVVTRLARDTDTVIVAVFTGPQPSPATLGSYREAGVAVVEDPARFVRSIELLAPFVETDGTDVPAGPAGTHSRDEAVELGPGAPWPAFAPVARRFDLPVVDGARATSATEAADIADEIGFPVVLKATAALEHKTEADAIALDLADRQAVEDAYGRVTDAIREHDPDLDARTVLVQAAVEGEPELVVGVVGTPFGPVMMFGWGGIYVEAVDDVAYKPLPITPDRARSLIESTAVGQVLAGTRGRKSHVESVASLLVDTATLYEAGSFDELEFNPVVVTGDGPVIVDALVA